jgi:secreted PhoX family phosphatase
LLVRNHEVRNPPLPTPLDEPVYDRLAIGGTTTLRVRLGADGTPTLISAFRSLGGTIVNCAGGQTPWGSWLTCEEATRGRSHGWEQPHGYVFEVRAVDDGKLQPAQPIRAMGRFVHEACAVDPVTGIVYLTEDQSTAGFYRYIPNTPGRLEAGGRLQMLAIVDAPHHFTAANQRQGQPRRVRWVDITDPDPAAAEQYPLAVFASGYAKGAALFSRLEGCWFADDTIYFNATDGGNARCGQIWQYRPRDAAGADGTLVLVYESPNAAVLNRPDNLTSSPRSGGLVICEDNSGPYVRGLSRDGQIFDFARNIINKREFAGACFSPDGRVLFFNLQGDTGPGGPGDLGYTFAVRGPWERGPL